PGVTSRLPRPPEPAMGRAVVDSARARETVTDEGFSLVEIVVAMFLLALVAVALLPALVSGIRYSAQQSAVATATRELNAVIEEMRQDPTCAAVAAAVATRTVPDGAGRP